jgi:hypothetical protein
MSIDRSTRKAFGISLSLHVLFISYFIASSLCPPRPQPLPRRLVVQSISLAPTSHKRPPVIAAAPKAAAPTEQASVAKEEQEPKSSPPVAEKHEENAPHEAVAPPEKEETHPPSEKEAAPAQDAPQPSVKKAAPCAKPQSATKSPVKVSASPKGKSVSPQKSKPQPSHSTPAKTNAKKSASSQTPSYDQKLLNEALQRLDKSKSATGKGGGTRGGSSNAQGVAHVGSVGALHAEGNLIGATDAGQDDAFEGYSSASPEACYIGDLIRRLQLNVRLPEPGEVKVKLSIKRNGTVAHVTVLTGRTTSIKRSIEEKLKAIHFSSFGTSFSGEAEHTFSLRLSNELIWSCS